MSLEINSTISLSRILKPKFIDYIKITGKKPNVIIMSADYKYSKTYEESISKLLKRGYKVIFSYEMPKKAISVVYSPDLKLKEEIDDKIPF